LKLETSSVDALEKTLLINTPIVEKTTENPKTKNTAFKTTFDRLIEMVEPPFVLSSVTVVPEMYARKAGIIGKMHGATNEPRPANAAMKIVTSTTTSIYENYIKPLFQFSPQSFTPIVALANQNFLPQ